MDREKFEQAVINTQARFALFFCSQVGDLSYFGNYVVFNEPQNDRGYYSIVRREIYRNVLPDEIKDYFDLELKSL